MALIGAWTYPVGARVLIQLWAFAAVCTNTIFLFVSRKADKTDPKGAKSREILIGQSCLDLLGAVTFMFFAAISGYDIMTLPNPEAACSIFAVWLDTIVLTATFNFAAVAHTRWVSIQQAIELKKPSEVKAKHWVLGAFLGAFLTCIISNLIFGFDSYSMQTHCGTGRNPTMIMGWVKLIVCAYAMNRYLAVRKFIETSDVRDRESSQNARKLLKRLLIVYFISEAMVWILIAPLSTAQLAQGVPEEISSGIHPANEAQVTSYIFGAVIFLFSPVFNPLVCLLSISRYRSAFLTTIGRASAKKPDSDDNGPPNVNVLPSGSERC